MLTVNRMLKELEDLEGMASRLFDRLGTHFGRDEELSLLFIRLGLDAASHASILRHMGQFMRHNQTAAFKETEGNGERFETLRKDLESLREQSSEFEGLDAVRAVLELETILMDSYGEDLLSACPAGLAHMAAHMHADCRNQIRELHAISRRRTLPHRATGMRQLRSLFGTAGR